MLCDRKSHSPYVVVGKNNKKSKINTYKRWCDRDDENVIVSENGLSKEEMVGMPPEYRGMSRAELEKMEQQEHEKEVRNVAQAIKNGTFIPDGIITIDERNLMTRGNGPQVKLVSIPHGAQTQWFRIQVNYMSSMKFRIWLKNNSTSQEDMNLYVYKISEDGLTEFLSSDWDIDPGKVGSSKSINLESEQMYRRDIVYVCVKNDGWRWQKWHGVTGRVANFELFP